MKWEILVTKTNTEILDEELSEAVLRCRTY